MLLTWAVLAVGVLVSKRGKTPQSSAWGSAPGELEAYATRGLTQLILKFSRPSGNGRMEDDDVLADGKVVGRIYEDADLGTPPELRWFWSVTAI